MSISDTSPNVKRSRLQACILRIQVLKEQRDAATSLAEWAEVSREIDEEMAFSGQLLWDLREKSEIAQTAAEVPGVPR